MIRAFRLWLYDHRRARAYDRGAGSLRHMKPWYRTWR